jgi:iron(III) transport system substrate-binding protein
MSVPNPSRRRRLAASVLVALAMSGAGGLLSGCSLLGGGADLVLYNGQHPETTDALVRAFEKATGITVGVRSDDEDVLSDLIVEEGSSSPADVIYTENTPALEFLQNKGLLAPVEASTLAEVPARDDSPEGDWVGVSARVSMIIYNTRLVSKSELPSSILDLAQPKWKGKLAIAPEETDFEPLVTAVESAYGKAMALSWLRGMRVNGQAHEYADNETITAQVNAGQAAIGVINQYYWYRLRAEIGAKAMDSALAFFSPRNPGYVVDVSGAAVLRSSRHKKAAQEFLSWLVSRHAQEIIETSTSYEYPLRPGVPAAPGIVPLSDLHPYPISLTQLGDGADAIALMHEAGLLP